jgi:hypothetical protein
MFTQSRMLIWVQDVTKKKRIAHRNLVGISDRKVPVRRPRGEWIGFEENRF